MILHVVRCIAFGLVLVGGVLSAQAAQGNPQGKPTPKGAEVTRTAIDALTTSIRAKQDEIESHRQQLQKIGNDAAPEERSELRKKIQAIEAELSSLHRQFDSIAAGVSLDSFESVQGSEFDLDKELVSALRPVIEEFKELTETPRENQRFKSEVTLYRQRESLAREAIQELEALRADPQGQAWSKEIAGALQRWGARLQDLRSKRAVAEQSLAQLEANRTSVFEAATKMVREFFSSRGFNLLVGILAGVLVFLLARFAGRLVRNSKLVRKSIGRSFYGRLAAVLFGVALVVVSLGAMLVAFYVTNDWLLLLITAIFLLGLGWASLRMVPRFFEEVRLLLNLGSVRESERLVLNGVPWRVERLQVYSYLVNPKLTGGLLRIPLKSLIGMQSRPIGSDEVWFPTNRGDWVVLADGRRAEVLTQSPDLVQLRQLGGALITCRTEEFLGMMATNLSHDFRIVSTFGVDYAHQAICTTEIPGIMREALDHELRQMLGEDLVVRINVEFSEAGSSSLDYRVLADFKGDAARDKDRITRAISRILVDVCNENGWIIPFTQITMHQAQAQMQAQAS